MPIAATAGLPLLSSTILGMARARKPTVITPKITQESFLLFRKYPKAKTIANGIIICATICTKAVK